MEETKGAPALLVAEASRLSHEGLRMIRAVAWRHARVERLGWCQQVNEATSLLAYYPG